MPTCNKCKLELKPDWAYCPYCGKPTTINDQTEIITTTNYKPITTQPKRPEKIQYRNLRPDYYQIIEQIKKESPKAYEKWTQEEETQLTEMYSQGKTITEIATQLQRQKGGIRARLKKLKLIE